MNPGKLRHRITIQKPVIATNDIGVEIITWQDAATVWASVSNLHGREYFAAATVQAENTVKFNIRHLPGIDTTMHIIFQGNRYNITAIDNIKYRNRYLEILALEDSTDDQ